VQVENKSDLIIGNLLQLTLKTRANDPVIRTSSDVGFGFTQIMPVIVQGVVSRADVICVEQPEIHLHPRLQAELTDFLIDTAKNNRNQWIIETHSELLVRRLQRRIREGSLDLDQVSVLYVDPISSQSSRIMELRLDEAGEFIDEWPEGFFDEGFNEATAPNSRSGDFLEDETLDIPPEETESLDSSR
jgi:predicted ATPase